MGKVQLLLSFLVLTVFSPVSLFAQERFDLVKRDGHYYFTAPIRDVPVEMMVESGIPAMLVGKEIFASCLESSGLAFRPAAQKIRLLNHVYNIVCKSEGMIGIGNSVYDGPVFVLEDYEGVAIPVQYLKDPVSQRSVLTIDLKDNYLLVGKREGRIDGTRYKLSSDRTLGFPVVAASVDLATPGGIAKLKGGLIVDFGNPSLLFLLKQHKSLAKAIRRKKIELKDAFDGQGRLVAQGVYADSVSLLGRKYYDLSIGVTDRMQSIEQLGFLGIPFFESPVVFDFDNGVMILSDSK